MKEKVISRNEFESMDPKGRLVFGVTSPFSVITPPPNSIMAWHAKPFIENFIDGIQTGTTYAIGVSVVKIPLKIYAWRVVPRENGQFFELMEHDKRALGYHHTLELPRFMQTEAPEWVINKIEAHLRSFNFVF